MITHRPKVGVIAVAALLMASGASSAQAAGTGGAPRELSRCVSDRGDLSVVILMDQSGSLHDVRRPTDPDDKRIPALKGMLNTLADATRSGQSGKSVDVNVALVGFWRTTRPSTEEGVEWMNLGSEDGLKRSLEMADSYKDADNPGTNYAAAMSSARRFLVDRDRARGGKPGCRAIMVFTDGSMAIPPGGSDKGDDPAAKADAWNLLCRPGGEVSKLLNDHVYRFALGLGGRDLGEFRSLILGGGQVGQLPTCVGSSSTAQLFREGYVAVAGANDLYWEFAQAFRDPAAPLIEGDRKFTVYTGIQRVVAEVALGREGQAVELSNLKSDPASFTYQGNGDSEEVEMSDSGAKVKGTWVSPTLLRLDIEIEGDEANGPWSLRYRGAGRPGKSAIRMYAALKLDVDAPDEVRIGEREQVGVKFTDLSGNPAGATPLTKAAVVEPSYLLTSTSEVATGSAEGPDPQGGFAGSVAIPANWPEGSGTLNIRATFKVDPTIVIQPVTWVESVPARFPDGQGFPKVVDSSVDFGSAEGKEAASAQFKVVPASNAVGDQSGCIWADAPKDVPDDVTVRITPTLPTSEADCEPIPAALKEGKTYTVTVSSKSGETDASLGVVIPLRLKTYLDSISGPKVRNANVEVSGQLYRYQNPLAQGLLTLLLVLIGIGIPLLGLYILNVRNARFARVDRLRYLSWPVLVAENGTVTDTEGEALSVPEDEAEPARLFASSGSANVKEIEVSGIRFETVAFEASRPQMLFSGPTAFATAGGSPLAVGQKGRAARTLDQQQEIGLALVDAWVFVPKPPASGAARHAAASSPRAAVGADLPKAADAPGVEGSLLVIFREFRSEEASRLLVSATQALEGLARQVRSGVVAFGPSGGPHGDPASAPGEGPGELSAHSAEPSPSSSVGSVDLGPARRTRSTSAPLPDASAQISSDGNDERRKRFSRKKKEPRPSDVPGQPGNQPDVPESGGPSGSRRDVY